MSEHYAVDQDLKEAQAMAKGLTPYVHQDTLYGSVGGGGFLTPNKMPALTIGALLMRIRRLDALSEQLTGGQTAELEQIKARHEEVRKEWRVHYEQKLLREANSRLDAMRTFFEECAEDPRLCANAYRPEAARRTLVQEVLFEIAHLGIEDDDLKRKVGGTDGNLRRYIQPADFLWDAVLQPVYPQGTFWWLYSRPPLPDNK